MAAPPIVDNRPGAVISDAAAGIYSVNPGTGTGPGIWAPNNNGAGIPAGGGTGTPAFGPDGLPASFAAALGQFNAPANSPFADLIAQAKQIAAMRRGQIEKDYVGYESEAKATGERNVAGAQSLGARFVGPGLDTFMDSFVASKVAESDKRLKDLGSAKDKALNDADINMLESINNLSIKEMERNDMLRQRQVDNAFKMMDVTMRQKEMSPEYLKMKAVFSDAELLRVGVTETDTPEQIQAKLGKDPEYKLRLQKLQADINASNRSNRGTPGAPGLSTADHKAITDALNSSKGAIDGYANTGVYRKWAQTIQSQYPGIDFTGYFPPDTWLNPNDDTAKTYFGAKPSFSSNSVNQELINRILNGG